jgi:hypothetical protein
MMEYLHCDIRSPDLRPATGSQMPCRSEILALARNWELWCWMWELSPQSTKYVLSLILPLGRARVLSYQRYDMCKKIFIHGSDHICDKSRLLRKGDQT